MRDLRLDDVQRSLRQRRVQLVVGQQLDAAIEMLGQGRYGEVRAGAFAGADRIELLLEGDAVEFFAAVGEQLVEHLCDAFPTLRLLRLRAVADVTEHRDGVADILGLHDELQPVRQGGHDGMERRGRHDQPLQGRFRPLRQLRGLGFAERDGFLAAEAATAGRHRCARALRHHHTRYRMIQIEILARHAVDVRDSDFLDAREVVIGRLQAVQASALPTRWRPTPRWSCVGTAPRCAPGSWRPPRAPAARRREPLS